MSSTDSFVTFPTLPERVAHCLLMLNSAGEQAELLQAGVHHRRVAALYPADTAALYPALNAYLDAGKLVEFPSPGAMYTIKNEDAALRRSTESVTAGPEAQAALLSLMLPGRRTASRIMTYPNAMIGSGQKATFIARHSHIRTGLSYLERAFWYAACCEFRDQNRVGHQLLRTTHILLPELLPEDY